MLIGLLAKELRKITIIIDDAHLCGPGVLKFLSELVSTELPNLRILLGSRSGLRKKISKGIVNSTVAYLSSAQLAFTEHELLTLLRVSKRVAKTQHDEFDGWPLAYVLLLRQPLKVNRQTTADELLASMPDIFNEFIDSEVFQGISEKQLNRAKQIAVIDRYKAQELQSICEMSEHESNAVFQSLKMFMLGEIGNVRLSRVVRDALRRRAWLESPKSMHDLCLRASNYYWSQGDLVVALSFAADSGKKEYICELIERAGGLLLWLHEGLDQLRKVMRFADSGLTASFPRLQLVQSLLYSKEGNLGEAKAHWNNASQISCGFTKDRDGGDDDALKFEGEVMASVLTIAGCSNLEHESPIFLSLADGTQYEDRSHIEQGYLLTISCISHLQFGDFDSAIMNAASAERAFREIGSLYGALYLNFHQGVASLAQGKPETAMAFYQVAERRRRQHFAADHGIKLVGRILSAEVDLERGALLSAKRKLKGLIVSMAVSEGWFELYAVGLRTLLHIERLYHDRDRVKETIYRARKMSKSKVLDRVCN